LENLTKFKCKISDLETICRFTSLKGKSEISGKEFRALMDALIVVTKEGLKIEAMDVQKHIAIRLYHSVESVEEEGSLPIGSIEQFEQFIGRFNPDDLVEVSTVENLLIINRESPRKVARFPLGDISAINSKDAPIFAKFQSIDGFYKFSKLDYNLKFVVDAEKILAVIEDGEVVKQRIYPWNVADNKLVIKIDGGVAGEIETDIPLESVEGKFKKASSGYAAGIDNLFSNLSGKVNIFMVDDSTEATPLIITQKTDKFEFLAILAPRVV
jgi:hypothetical protein